MSSGPNKKMWMRIVILALAVIMVLFAVVVPFVK